MISISIILILLLCFSVGCKKWRDCKICQRENLKTLDGERGCHLKQEKQGPKEGTSFKEVGLNLKNIKKKKHIKQTHNQTNVKQMSSEARKTRSKGRRSQI